MEYACGVANSKMIVVLGHTKCSAVISACNNFKMGHITTLLSKLKPAIKNVNSVVNDRNGQNIDFVNEVCSQNVYLTIDQIRKKSRILNILEKDGKIMIVGGLYNVETGEVIFYDEGLTIK
jgi:carbonic anhydrase